MNVAFENLNELPKLLEMVVELKSIVEKGNLEKRWFNTHELSEYTGYKYETLKSKIKKGEFVQGVHYFKRDGKLLFDKTEVDNWVMGVKSVNHVSYQKEDDDDIVEEISSLMSA